MMADELTLSVNTHGLEAAYARAPEEVDQALHTTTEVGIHTFESAVVQFTPRGVGPVHLFQTVTGEVRGAGLNITGEVFSTDVPIKVLTVEYGRTAGKPMPPWGPGSALALWVERKAGGDKSAAFLIARAIGRRGTKGAHMFQRAFDARRAEVEALFDRVIDDLMARL